MAFKTAGDALAGPVGRDLIGSQIYRLAKRKPDANLLLQDLIRPAETSRSAAQPISRDEANAIAGRLQQLLRQLVGADPAPGRVQPTRVEVAQAAAMDGLNTAAARFRNAGGAPPF